MAAPRLLDAVRGCARARHYSYLTENAYLHWIRRFIRFHCFRPWPPLASGALISGLRFATFGCTAMRMC